jgi:NACalpha-BTF3-like transcription factor
MAEEPQPSNVQEGADPPDALPANAEDRKAAKAMSSLESARSADVEAPAAPKKEVDVKALTDAMKMLEAGSGAVGRRKKSADESKKRKEEEVKKIKVDAADVSLVMEQCDMGKVKATELLRTHDADVGTALRAWVTAAV